MSSIQVHILIFIMEGRNERGRDLFNIISSSIVTRSHDLLQSIHYVGLLFSSNVCCAMNVPTHLVNEVQMTFLDLKLIVSGFKKRSPLKDTRWNKTTTSVESITYLIVTMKLLQFCPTIVYLHSSLSFLRYSCR